MTTPASTAASEPRTSTTWWAPRMGERGRRLPPLQQPEGGPPPPRGRLPAAARATGAQGDALDRDRRRPHRTWLGAVPGPGGRRRPRLSLPRPTRASLAAFAAKL